MPTPDERDLMQHVHDTRERLSRNQAPILKYFAYDHLPSHLQEFSKPFADLAHDMDERLPDGAEKSAGLRKLLEAKDCFVRARLP